VAAALGDQETTPADMQVQHGGRLLSAGRYADAQQAYRRALGTGDEA
jgi:hypothetical protein